MIYPATLNIEILQNSTFKVVFRVLQKQRQISSIQIVNSNPFFTVQCHDLVAGDKVVIVPSGSPSANFLSAATTFSPLCKMSLNQVYFVSSANITDDVFTISATNGGSPIVVGSALLSQAGLSVAQPVNLTGFTVDADLIDPATNQQVATFTCALETAADGLCSALMTPATTAPLDPKTYKWDVSLTSSSGERYYYLTGDALVTRTYSRNT
jgi:hypothetical protein